MIYFVKFPYGAIKIGYTSRMVGRLRSLRGIFGKRLEVLGVAGGSPAEETYLHFRFVHLHAIGEWFDPGQDLLDFIASKAIPWDGTNDEPCVIIVREKYDRPRIDDTDEPEVIEPAPRKLLHQYWQGRHL